LPHKSHHLQVFGLGDLTFFLVEVVPNVIENIVALLTNLGVKRRSFVPYYFGFNWNWLLDRDLLCYWALCRQSWVAMVIDPCL